jgi:hypothetical protein
MSDIRRSVLVCCGVIAATAGFGEQRLPDIAGGIELQRPAGEQLVIVAEGPEDQGGRVAVTGSDLVGMTEQLLEQSRHAAEILQETRTSLAFFDDGWRRRMLGALSDLDTTRTEFELCNPPDRYAEAVTRVTDGARDYQIAAGMLRWAISRDQARFSGAFEHLAAGDREVGAALAGLRVETLEQRYESDAPPPDPFAARQSAVRLCASRYGQGTGSGFDRCVAAQQASYDAITRRFSFTVGLDETSFNSIRNHCRDEWPDDLVSRDRCEQQRMAAAR